MSLVRQKKEKPSIFSEKIDVDVSKQTGRNIKINVGEKFIRFILQTASTIVLARLLTPEDYGLVGMVAIIVNFVALFKDAGLAHATIQKDKITNEQISTLFWINAAIGLALSVCVAGAAPIMVWIYSEPRVFAISLILALPVFMSSLGLQHRALLQRNMRFWEIARIDLLSSILGICAAIFSALMGLSYWSLVVMQVTSKVAETGALWNATMWKPLLPGRGYGIRGMLKFGLDLTGYNFIQYLSRNADNLIIGKFVGVSALGQYSRAYSLMMLPLGQLSFPISKAVFPALSRIRHDEAAYSNMYLGLVKKLAWLTVIPIAAASIYGEEIVIFLLGNEWSQAGALFEWLAIAGFLQPLSSILGVVFTSLGQTNRLLRWGVFSGVFTVGAFCVGGVYGAEGVAIAYAVSINCLFPLFAWYTFRRSPISFFSYWGSVGIPVGIALVIVVVSVFLKLGWQIV